jgi:hypothetical protein
MSKIASHESFGHLQHKLWSKEGPSVKLPIWLPTTKSRQSTRPPVCAGRLRHIVGKLSRRATSLPQTSSQSKVWARSYECPKSRESKPTQFRETHLGVPGQKAIWMWPPWSGAKYTIWGKVVASPKSGPWWIKWIQSCPWLVLAPRVLQNVN